MRHAHYEILADARHYADHQAMLGIDGHVVPIVAASSVGRIRRIATFFLFVDERPLFVELNLACLGGKRPRVRREVALRGRRPSGYIASPCLYALPSNDWFCERRSLLQHAQAQPRFSPRAGLRRTRACLSAPKTSPCRFDSGACAVACSARSDCRPTGFHLRVPHSRGTPNSGNKTATDHP